MTGTTPKDSREISAPASSVGVDDSPIAVPPRALTSKTFEMRSHEPVHIVCGVASSRGRKMNQEDAYYVGDNMVPIDRMTLNGYTGSGTAGYFGIFDGHGGDRASKYCAQYLMPRIQFELSQETEPNVREAMAKAVQAIDKQFCDIAKASQSVGAIRHLNAFPLQQHQSAFAIDDGSTCLVALIHRSVLYLANTGDSRGLLCTRDQRITCCSMDQKPNRKDERRRLEAKGAVVTGPPSFLSSVWPLKRFLDVPRVNGSLAMSRSIGDVSLKEFITAEPEIISQELSRDHLFLILATDGLWDVCTNRKAVQIACGCRDAQDAADTLMHFALERRTMDNVTVVVVHVPSFLGLHTRNASLHEKGVGSAGKRSDRKRVTSTL